MSEKLKEWKCTQCKDECILKIREDDGSPTFCPFGMDSFKNRPVEPKWEIINTPKHETVEELQEVKNLLVLKTKDLNDIIKKYDYMNYTCLQCDYFSFGMAKYTNKQDPDCKLHKRHTQSHCRCKDLKREGLSD